MTLYVPLATCAQLSHQHRGWTMLGSTVCVSGPITEYEGRPEIRLESADQLKWRRAPIADTDVALGTPESANGQSEDDSSPAASHFGGNNDRTLRVLEGLVFGLLCITMGAYGAALLLARMEDAAGSVRGVLGKHPTEKERPLEGGHSFAEDAPVRVDLNLVRAQRVMPVLYQLTEQTTVENQKKLAATYHLMRQGQPEQFNQLHPEEQKAAKTLSKRFPPRSAADRVTRIDNEGATAGKDDPPLSPAELEATRLADEEGRPHFPRSTPPPQSPIRPGKRI